MAELIGASSVTLVSEVSLREVNIQPPAQVQLDMKRWPFLLLVSLLSIRAFLKCADPMSEA